MENVSVNNLWKRLAEIEISQGVQKNQKIYFTRSIVNARQGKYANNGRIKPKVSFIKNMESIKMMGFQFGNDQSKGKILPADIKINAKHGESLQLKIMNSRFIKIEKENQKYWMTRHTLFSKFDCGIQLDQESWYSVTPELLAKQIASRMKCHTVIDAFCGAGGNIIQFAMVCDKVIAIDIDENKIRMARHNARIYGVEHKIEFINKDFLEFVADPTLKVDALFFSAPWGGPAYRNESAYSLDSITPNMDAIMAKSKSLTDNIAVYLPRNTKIDELVKYSHGSPFEVEQSVVGEKLKVITAYYGNLANTSTDPISMPEMFTNRVTNIECSSSIPQNTNIRVNIPSKWNNEENVSLRPTYKSFNHSAGNKDAKNQSLLETKCGDRSKTNNCSSLENKLANALQGLNLKE